MKHFDHLDYIEPSTSCEVKVGTFTFTNPQGEECVAEFYIHTCIDDSPAGEDKRVDDYNQQFTDEWTKLYQDGCSNITYREVTPSPIF